MKIEIAHSEAMWSGLIIDVLVNKVGVSYFPEDDKLTLFDLIFDPRKAHVDGFWAVLFDGSVGNTSGGGVIGGYWGG